MKERPILMTPENAQKCHDGLKTMTRRIVKPQPEFIERIGRPGLCASGWPYRYGKLAPDLGVHIKEPINPPYGLPGDRLWVRERLDYRCVEEQEGSNPADINRIWAHVYAGSNMEEVSSIPNPLPAGYKDLRPETVPSLFMPRWASRTLLEICSVRVERLNEITGDDALSEGISKNSCYGPGCLTGADGCNERGCWGYRDAFRSLWESIHGKGAWDLNPWVWVIEFRRVNQ